MKIFNYNLDVVISNKIEYLNSLGIKEFGYRQFHSDGKTLGYCSQAKWNNFIEKHNFSKEMSMHYSKEINNLIANKQKYCVRIGERVKNSPFLEALYNHGLWNTLVVYKYHADKIEGFYFISSLENCSMVNFYINRLELFDKFISAVQIPINEIFAEKEDKGLNVNIEPSNLINFNFKNIESNSILEKIKSNSIRFLYQGTEISLTKKEIDYLLLVTLGYHNKEIGDKLSISLRTVEKYSSQIKSKFDFGSRKQLIQFVYDSQLSLLIKDVI